MRSLKKSTIIKELATNYGINIKSVQKLNKLLEEMGIIRRSGGFLKTTTEGLKYSNFNLDVLNLDLWRESIVVAIANYLKNK